MIPTWLLVSVIMTVKSLAWPVSVEVVNYGGMAPSFQHVRVLVDGSTGTVVAVDLYKRPDMVHKLWYSGFPCSTGYGLAIGAAGTALPGPKHLGWFGMERE
jgi:putative effector of murein hydrolase